MLSVNGTTLEQAAVEDAVQLLAQSGIVVRMEIVPYHLFSVRPGFNQEGEVWGVTVGCVCGSVVCVCVCVRVQCAVTTVECHGNTALHPAQFYLMGVSTGHSYPSVSQVTTTCPPPA